MMTIDSCFSNSVIEKIFPTLTQAAQELPERWLVFDILKNTGHRFPSNVWCRILKKHPELKGDIYWVGPPNRQQPYLTEKGAVYLLTLLPGKIGKQYRSLVFDTLWLQSIDN
jgi:hypothetical protein